MTDGTPGDGHFSSSSEVDVQAIEDSAYERGRLDGCEECKVIAFAEGYAECRGDTIERLRSLGIFDEGRLEQCISEIEKMERP